MSNSKRVVAISHPSDVHLAFVEKHLPHPLILIDQTAIIDGASLTFDVAGDSDMRVILDGNEVKDVCGVWYRRPEAFKPELLPVEPHLRQYSFAALNEFGMLTRSLFPAATWVSDYYAIRRAENKVVQLSLARKLGFNVPDTIVTSDEAAARRFIRGHESVVSKPIQVEFFEQDGEMHNFFTKKIDESVNLSGLNLAPAIFQAAIDVGIDLRITVVGDKVFAASIADNPSDPSSDVRDWRMAQYREGLNLSEYALPDEIAARCISLVHELGLNFGAVDMILDKKGTYWFLENNPNGQWAFVEEITGQPIGKAIAELLMGITR